MTKASLSKLAVCWYMIVAPIVIMDGIYVLMRPKPDDKNQVHPLTDTPILGKWNIYAEHDHRYKPNADCFVVLQTYLNLAEVAMGLLAVVLHLCGAGSAALKVSLTTSILTLYKTIMYAGLEFFEDYKYTKHNSPRDALLLLALPTIPWYVVPTILIAQAYASLTAVTVANARPKKQAHSGSAPSPKATPKKQKKH